MGKEKELNTTEKLVKSLLMECPATRNSDNYLYIKVVERLNSSALDKPFSVVLANLSDLGLPCFETVRRTRAKIQAEHSELKANDVVQDFRTANEEEFRRYAKS